MLSGLKLGSVKTINEAASGDTTPPPVAHKQAAMPDIPLEPGTQTVTFTVTVTWNPS